MAAQALSALHLQMLDYIVSEQSVCASISTFWVTKHQPKTPCNEIIDRFVLLPCTSKCDSSLHHAGLRFTSLLFLPCSYIICLVISSNEQSALGTMVIRIIKVLTARSYQLLTSRTDPLIIPLFCWYSVPLSPLISIKEVSCSFLILNISSCLI